ncbi:MAG: RagB/SusD family nutrient uptake outer membrane protein, partial [Odoribacter sp.]|nr:RagB/SusD family nutrient uptake outer membrane protein [Odoribacter sp.]
MIYKGMLLAALCTPLTACNDWLNVQPESQVEDTELFKSETGFKEALSGVYSSMVSDNTYAKELTFGAMGVMGQEWTTYPSVSYGPSYQYIVEYNYSTSASENMIAAIWSTSYNSIANANNILKHIDVAKKLFSGNNYAIIKGEALALRAFLHFDLLRCFGVSYEVNPDMPAIPYCTDLTYRVFPQLTVKQVAEKVETDLLEAEKLLAVDPILTGEEITELDDNGYLMNRQVHLNYYAVKGLQARLYMWMKRYADAERCAKAVIDSEVFFWVNSDEMNNGTDLAFATEQLFALNNINLLSVSETYFNPEGGAQVFSIDEDTWNDYYTDGGDIRYVCLSQPGPTSIN